VWPGVGADGDLLVGTNAQGPFVRTFGTLAGTQPEIVRLRRRLIPVPDIAFLRASSRGPRSYFPEDTVAAASSARCA
jgi:hypothetical protein